MAHPLLAATDYGLVIASAVVLLVFVLIGWVIMQGTRAQLYWRNRADEGDVEIITMLVTEELGHWRTMRVPKGVEPATWHGVQSVELVGVEPDGVRLSTTAEGQYATTSGRREQVTGSLQEGMKVTARVADMALYDIPNVRLPWIQVDIYSTYRDETGSSQRCILSTVATRDVGDHLDWDGLEAEAIVQAFGGRYLLDDRGNPLPIDPEGGPRTTVPAAFYTDD